ncbi:phage tail tip lysozyme [Flavisphingomonas formosensis]|uniref:phage tail tip lysozyme n=1 Tax=Flavisphingomonas formosensis TaxID=861534 RepID=UPI0012FAA6FC|nr:phage tail tip lysozyme [Sphingomonas formosensis]
MPRVPHPDPLYPVVWADAPTVPDSPATPAISGLPDDDDPIQLHLDEALVRKADNDTVDRWKTLSGPWFAARGGDAASRWKDIEQSLNEIVRRPLGELDTVRQRNMYRDIMAPRLSAWGDEARAHAERETQAFNDAESQRRQDIALEAMRRGARLGDMRAVAEGERRLVGEVRGRSRRQGLDPDAASAAETDARAAAHADVVEHLAQHDPRQAQDWLNARAATIGDAAKVDRLHGMLQPYVAEQQQEGLAGLIRDEGGDLPAQHAAVDAMGLDPAIADGLKQRLADMAEGDRRAVEKEQDAAFSRVMTSVLDPETQALRGIPLADYYALTPERLDTIRAIMAANLRGQVPAANPELDRNPADKVAQGSFSLDDMHQVPVDSSTPPTDEIDGAEHGNDPTGASLMLAAYTPATPATPPSARARQTALAEKWQRLSPSQRLRDPDLADAARAVEASKKLLQQDDKSLYANLGPTLAPGGDYTKNQVIKYLDLVVAQSIANGGTFKVPPDNELASGGKHAMYLFKDIRKASFLALRERQIQALAFLTSPSGGGWSREQAAGIVANLTIESFLDPQKKQKPGKGYGLAQWDINGPRAKNFSKLFPKQNLVGSSITQQLAFITYELKYGAYRKVGSMLSLAKTPDESSRIITNSYEKPSRFAKNGPNERAIESQNIYNSFFSSKKYH